MKLRDAARRAADRLEVAHVPDAAFEAELLARAAAGVSRAEYFAGAEASSGSLARLDEFISRRAGREPAAYITGTREFYGLDFAVTPAVLIPRPETELLVEAALSSARDLPAPTILDVGAGSGCVAVSIAVNAPHAWVVAIDQSGAALDVARTNAEAHNASVSLVRGSLAEPVRAADIVVANLPYIPRDEIAALEPEVRDWEPRGALDGGPDGLDLIRLLIADCGARLRPSLLAMEVGAGQARQVACLAAAAGAATDVIRDLAGIDRVVTARWS